ncbi:terminase large subunit [Bacillus infantis]|uniref:terminase large subunit n=1 Tax=Bacillus infantis TaxID=324767 RepID=UPI003CEEC0EE
MTSLIERVYNYAIEITEGNITACKKHIYACERFLNDLEKAQNDEASPYYFDADELYDFYDWAFMFKHKEGVVANQPIELTDFQLFIVCNIFCWKLKSNNTRRIKRVYIQVARKQAKSQLQALIASYVAFLSDEKEQVYIAGVTKEQSKIVYQQILDQINAADFLKGKYSTSYGVITHKKSGSIIQPLSKEAKKTGDGKFPSLNIIDEYHSHPTSEIFDVLLSGQIGRRNALHVVITTAGLDLSVPCYKEYEYVSKVLDPESVVENEEYFIMICELDKDEQGKLIDDIKDESVWIKANPIVATYEEGMKDLRDRLKVALEIPDKMTEFLTKHMNVWVQRKHGGYMDLSKWNNCGIAKRGIPLPNIIGKEVYISYDLSAKHDLTSVAFLIPHDEYLIVLGHSFMPEETLKTKMKTDKFNYELYEQQGWITATEGEIVDYKYLKKYIYDFVKEHKLVVKEVCVDEWNALQLATEMSEDGYKTATVSQTIKGLAPATKDFRDKVYQLKVIHDDNPVINWAMGNAVTIMDSNENFKIDKSKSTERIDPVAAIITGHARAIHHNQSGDLNRHILSEGFSF